MITILTDSCADLGQPLLDAYGVQFIPLHVLVNGIDHLDSEYPITDLFKSVSETGELPKTAAPSVKEFQSFFDRQDSILYIGLSSQLSATMSNAQLAKDLLDKADLHLIDSKNLSTGIGLLVLKAIDLMNAGESMEEIIAEIEATRPKVRTAFVIDTMDYLYKGGRCTALQAIFGSMLQIRPVINVREDGTLGVLDKIRGSRKKTLDRLIKGFQNDLPNVDLTRVFVTHTGCIEDAEYLTEELKALAEIENVHITTAGATIASHCGPDTIGILYITQ
jgi:DegV family protein with EDD domain